MEYVKLKKIAKYPTGKLDSNAAVDGGAYPFFTCAQVAAAIDTYAYDGEYILLGGNNANGNFPVFYYKGKFNAYQRTYLIQPTSDNIDTKYLYYAIQLKLNQMRSNASGTATKFLTKPILDNINIEYRSIDEQRRISSILSAYDDLIENNNRRIKILEQMAENLYKEWFVRFRFPGYEQAEFENGIPKGWERVRLYDIIDFNPIIKKTNHLEYKIIPMSALSNTGLLIDDSLFETSEKLEGSRSCNGDTLLARITPCLENGKTGYVQGLKHGEVVGGSTEFIVMRAKSISRFLVYFIARDPLFRGFAIASMNGADGRQRVKVEKLKKTQWIKPDRSTNAVFEEKCELIFGLIYKLYSKNQNLTKQRDLLLPRLMSGKLEV